MLNKIRLIITIMFIWGANTYAQEPNETDEEHQRLEFIKTRTQRADSLNRLALDLAAKDSSRAQLNEAIGYIMQSLKIYSGFSDSVGLRQSFDNLGLVYHLQKKYSQAKWFILQSNTISREKNDTANIIISLLNLAKVKTDIKDYSLAERDLKEAAEWARKQRAASQQIVVQNNLVDFYNRKGDVKRAAIVSSKIQYIIDSASHFVSTKKPLLNKTVTTSSPLIPSDSVKQADDVFTPNKPNHGISVTLLISLIVITILAALSFDYYVKRKKK